MQIELTILVPVYNEIHLLENLRFHKGETENDPSFSSQLAKHGDVFINDAFGTSHRCHASNVGVVPFFSQRGIGFLVENELKLEEVLDKFRVLGASKYYGFLPSYILIVSLSVRVSPPGGRSQNDHFLS